MAKNTGSDGRTGLLETEEANRLLRSKFNAETVHIPDPVLDEAATREAETSFLRSQRRVPVRRRGGPRFFSRFGLGTRWVRLFAAVLIVAALGLVAMAGFAVKTLLLHNRLFTLHSAENIQVDGNRVVTAPQALAFFAPDLGRSIFRIPLAQRQAELEQIQWVRMATVMRLWPNRLRVTVVERTPVAFALDGNTVRLVDDRGILLDLPDAAAQHYSFPVLNGIAAAGPLSIRAARIAMYLQFVRALDAEGGHISSTLSEVDLSDPEDVRAIFVGGGRQPLVHFGDSDYLARYQAYQSHLTEWLQQYPALRSVDMRYGKQVVLDTGSVANTPQTAAVALPSEASVDRAGPGGTSIPLVGTEKPLKKNGTSMPQRNTASVTMKKHISATRRGRRMPHAGKMRSRESRHAPQRGHTVRNPIMHVASGM